jgi:hypothetical protein
LIFIRNADLKRLQSINNMAMKDFADGLV